MLTGQGFLIVRLHLLHHFFQNMKPLIDGFAEFVFFLGQYLYNEVPLLFQFRITVSGTLDHRFTELREETVLDSKKPSMAGRTADQPAQHIAAAFIGGHDTVGDHKRG